MNVREFGEEGKPVIILLHGGGLSWWNYREEAAILQQDFHVVIPLLDGHAGSDRHFTSIEESAAALCRYIGARFNSSVLAIGGLSLGGQILVEMLSQAPGICRYALIESALVIPMPVTGRMIGPAVRMSYGLIRQRWFARLQFAQLRMKPELFEEYYEDSCRISREDLTAILRSSSSYAVKGSLKETAAKAIIAVGGREQRKMLKSAALLHQSIPGSTMLVLPGYEHGALSLSHAARYAELLRAGMKERSAEKETGNG